jgi:Carboxypeptidase regulatory-like domain
MHFLLMLVLAATTTTNAPGALEATIRGTSQPLEVELFLRDEKDEWKEVGHHTLPAQTRRVRFDALTPGVYQIRLRGAQETEQLATKVVVGRDTRTLTINVEPFTLTGRITLGGTDLGVGRIGLRHQEFHWRGLIPLAADGAFRAPMWQRGAFMATVRAPVLPTAHAQPVEISGAKLLIDVPDGRIRGLVRDAKSGAPVANVLVLLRSKTSESESNVKLTTDADGRFDFVGIRHGEQTVRLVPDRHLEPAPVTFTLDGNNRSRELELKLDPGRSVAVVVIDRENDPVGKAKVFAVADSQICSRVTTDEDGMANVPVPVGRPATLFVVGEEGPFGMLRVGRNEERGRLQVYLPRSSSSLYIRAQTTDGQGMPPFSLLMRYNGELVPVEIADELEVTQGVHLAAMGGEAHLRNIPSGSYEFWPYRSEQEVESIIAAGSVFPPITVDVRSGENKIAVKFAKR